MGHEITEHKHTDTEPQDSMLSEFLERVRSQNQTHGSFLHDLYKEEGNSPAFVDALDDVVFDIAFEDPTYAGNAKRLQSPITASEGSRRYEAEEAERTAISREQRAISDEIRRLVVQEAGIPTNEVSTDIQKGRMAVLERLGDIDLAAANSDDLLRKLGILKEDDKGGATFTYPEDLFPVSVNEKWNMYIASVENHIRKSAEVLRGEVDRTELETADKMRRFAHNGIASDLNEILGFSDVPNETWDFERTRVLVAKMREAKFIGTPSKESELTSKVLAHSMGALGLSILHKLSDRKNQ